MNLDLVPVPREVDQVAQGGAVAVRAAGLLLEDLVGVGELLAVEVLVLGADTAVGDHHGGHSVLLGSRVTMNRPGLICKTPIWGAFRVLRSRLAEVNPTETISQAAPDASAVPPPSR